MKKHWLITLAGFLLASALLAGCSKSDPTVDRTPPVSAQARPTQSDPAKLQKAPPRSPSSAMGEVK